MKNPAINNAMKVIIVAAVIVLAGAAVYAIMLDTNEQPVAQPQKVEQEQTQTDAEQTTPSAEQNQDITIEQAEQVALDRFGGTVVEVEMDTHEGRPTWEVELIDTSEGRVEVDVDRKTGEIIAWERND